MIKVLVPATTANLGPGYDVLGMALKQYSEFEAEKHSSIEVVASGLECHKIDKENNLVIDSMNHLFKYVNKYPEGYKLHIKNNIAMSRGMGSSAAAIVGGLFIANYLVDANLDNNEILKLATEIEGHPDNVAPAIFGKIVLSKTLENGDVIYREINAFDDLRCVLYVPEYEVSTKDSRGVLPKEYKVEDVVVTSSMMGMLIYGFINNDKKLIGLAMNDVLHEPYRKKLIKGFDEFKKSALEAGAFSFALSGSGSTVIAFCDKDAAESVKNAFEKVSKDCDIEGEAIVLEVCNNGAVCNFGG